MAQTRQIYTDKTGKNKKSRFTNDFVFFNLIALFLVVMFSRMCIEGQRGQYQVQTSTEKQIEMSWPLSHPVNLLPQETRAKN